MIQVLYYILGLLDALIDEYNMNNDDRLLYLLVNIAILDNSTKKKIVEKINISEKHLSHYNILNGVFKESSIKLTSIYSFIKKLI